MILKHAKKALAARAEDALMEQLPVNPRALRRVSWLMEPKHLKHIAIVLIGGSLAASAIGTASEMRMYRRAMAKELKKQLEPINRKLDELKEENEELKKQNRQLRDRLDHHMR